MKKALITGLTGQDGSYLTEFLLGKGYQVCGLARRSSTFNTQRIDHLIDFDQPEAFTWERADLADSDSLTRVLRKFKPDEVYHLGAQSHVGVSFEIPNYTFDVVAGGTLRLLEAIRSLEIDCGIYIACSSEMFGSSKPPQDESTPFQPQSPYAIAKVASYHMGVLYRQAYGMKISNGILFNHESARRGETFVTRKITRAVSRIAHGIEKKVSLGNLDSYRDWGHAPEYVEAMWMMLQSDTPDDYVLATGETHSVREFVEASFRHVGVNLRWEGVGVEEVGILESFSDGHKMDASERKIGDVIVEINSMYFRPAEVGALEGNAKKFLETFNWRPKAGFSDLVRIMTEADMENTRLLLDGTRKSRQEWRKYII